MSPDYLLGRDIAELRESLRRIEAKLEAPGNRGRDNAGQRERTGFISTTSVPRISSTPAVAKKSERALAASINWKATDENNSRRVRLPDGSAEIVFFAYMLGPIADVNPGIPADISALIWPNVESLYNSDTSASQRYYYRPTGRTNETAVLGFYNRAASIWSWILVEFWHVQDNPNARFSRVFDMNGGSLGAYNGWVDAPFDLGTNNYKFKASYADCDAEIGLGFSFGDFYQ